MFRLPLLVGVVGIAIALTVTLASSAQSPPTPPERTTAIRVVQTHRGKTAQQWYRIANRRLHERDRARSKAGESIRYSRKLERTLVKVGRMLARHPTVASPPVAVIARAEAARLGVTGAAWDCLAALISRENANSPDAWNPFRYNGAGSGAYGLPQALPGSKMYSAGSDWWWNPATQVRWMIGYVEKYGGACGADAYQRAHNSY